MPEFTEWPKTHRLYRTIIVSEKLDGTNAALHIEKLGDVSHITIADESSVRVGSDVYRVTAQSRKRLIYPGKGPDGTSLDNYGFAAWCQANAARLVETFGQGLHFGEWWGKGINRGYGIEGRRFSLFNTDKHKGLCAEIGGVVVEPVPVMYQGMFSDESIKGALADLAYNGSVAAPGFLDPEGVCVFHSQTRSVWKVTLDNQDCSKWEPWA
jgi:hypothetical protein